MFLAIPSGYRSTDGQFTIWSLDDQWHAWQAVPKSWRLIGRYDDPHTAAKACTAAANQPLLARVGRATCAEWDLPETSPATLETPQ